MASVTSVTVMSPAQGQTDLSDIIRKELATFREALLVDVEKVFAQTLTMSANNGMQGCPVALSQALDANGGCESPGWTNDPEGHTQEGDLFVDVLEEADEEATDFAQELEAMANPVSVQVMHDDSFASTFMAMVAADEDLHKPPYSVDALYNDTGIFQAIARDHRFKHFMLLMVFFNAVYIGIELDVKGGAQLYDSGWPFIAAENFFCVAFLFEMIVRFAAFRRKRDCLRDGWFRFDLVLVVLAVLEVWVIVPMMAGTSAFNLPLAPIRVLRCLKMTRMTRVLKAIPELMIMSKGMLLASRAVLSSMLMILFLNYMFAVVLQLLLSRDTEINEILHSQIKRDFSNIPACMWTLFIDGTQMSAGDVILTELMASKSFAAICASVLIICYMLLSSLVIMNMLIGCLCEVVSSVGLHHKEETAKNLMKQSILVDLQKFDNGDGLLNRNELQQALKSEQSKQVLKSLQIDELFLKELQSMLFPHPDSQVSIKAVMQLMLSCRGDLDVTVLHLARGQAFLSTLICGFEKKVLESLHSLPRGGVTMTNACSKPVEATQVGKMAFSL